MQNEERVEEEALNWLMRTEGFQIEFLATREDKNARFDVCGLLDGRPYFIEVKPDMGEAEVLQIESKISGAFRDHHDPAKKGALARAMRRIWDGKVFPVVATISENVPARSSLLKILENRAVSWQFDWVVWEWRNSKLGEIAGSRDSVTEVRDENVHIEAINPPAATRNPLPGFEILQNMAQERGVIDLFEKVIFESHRLGASITHTSAGATMYWNNVSEVTVVLDHSSADAGLVVGCREAAIAQLDTERIRPASFRRFNWQGVSIQGIDDVAYLMEIVYATRSRP